MVHPMQVMHQQEQCSTTVLRFNFLLLVTCRGAPAVTLYFLCRMEPIVMRRDHLGYYDALGLEPGAASLPAIKDAFRQAALMWHPDRQKVRPSSGLVVCIHKMPLFLKAKIGFHEQSLV